MPDEHTTDTSSSHLDALETELAEADPADAPVIAEEIAGMLSDSLDATQAGRGTAIRQEPADTGPEAVGESQS